MSRHGLYGCAALILAFGLPSAEASQPHRSAPPAFTGSSARATTLAPIRPRQGFIPAVIYAGSPFGEAVSQTVVIRQAPMPSRITIVNEPPAVAGIRPQPVAAPVIYVIRPPGWRPPQVAEAPPVRGSRRAAASAPIVAADDSFMPRIVEVRPR